MTSLSVFLLILVGVLVGAFAFFLLFNNKLRNKKEENSFQNEILLLQNQLNHLTKVLDEKLSESNKVVQNELNFSRKIIADVTEKLVRLEETNKQVMNFADQLQSLEDILKNPKQRGILGEYFLENLLRNTLPPGMYKLQYEFKNGDKVDAAIFIRQKDGSKIIPVDAKFSLENYNRIVEEKDPKEKERLEKLFVNNLKERILETAKYIRPEENTLDFAFMFIPHEAIYYDLLINKVGAITEETENLIQRAASKYRVIIVSPTSFLAYLQTVLQGLRAFQIEESAKEIKKRVEELGKHLLAYETYFKKMGKSLETTVNIYNNAGKEFKKIDKDILKITGEPLNVSPQELDKPEIDDYE
jgi:DNA recombination protein RmuC